MSLISRLGVVLGLDTAEFSAGLGKADNDLKKFGASSMAMVGTLAAVGSAFAAFSASAIAYADQINDVALANDVAVSNILEFSQALSTNGGHLEDVGKIYSTFTRKLDEARESSQKLRDTYKELGISENELANLSEQQIFERTISALGEMKDRTHASAIAFELYGKSMKTVDLKNMAKDFEDLKGTMEGMDQKFHDIGDGVDAWGRIWAKFKQDWVKDFGPLFKEMSEEFESFLKYMDTQYIPATMAYIDKFTESWRKFLGIQSQAPKPYEYKIQDSSVNGTWDDSKKGGGWDDKPGPKTLKQTPEQIAAAKKLADEYTKQAEALGQASLEIERQKNAIGLEQTGYEKLLNEFEKGGKYYRLRGTAQEAHLLAQQKELDNENEKANRAKKVAQQAIALEAEERAARAERAKEVAQMVIKQSEFYRTTLETAGIDKERLDLQKQLVGASDSQAQKALALFDIEKEMIKIQKENPLLKPEELEKIKAAKVAVVNSQEDMTRASKTFQAGWSKAWENYKEKATDSAAIAGQAFSSVTSSMESALDSFVTTGKLNFSSLAQSIIGDLIKMQLKAQATSLFGGLFGGGGGGGFGDFGLFSSSTNFNNGAGLLGGFFADGGEPPVGKPSIVGERGPELFVPKTAGTVIPNGSLASAMGNQPQVVYNGTVVQSMSAIDTQSAVQFLSNNKNAVWSANMSAQRSLPMSR
jgi:lambda family phage tail tape measure protein